MLEGRVALAALKHVARTPDAHGKHVLSMVDNLSVVCSFSKNRASDFGLLNLTRKICSFVCAFGITCHWRYLETERNPADGPTRPEFLSAKYQGDSKQISFKDLWTFEGGQISAERGFDHGWRDNPGP